MNDDPSTHPPERSSEGSTVASLRAVLLGFVILVVGGGVSGAVMVANLQLAPTLAFLPFFLAHGLTMGLLVFYTRSIMPGIVLHAVSDFIVLPMQYGVIPSAGRSAIVWQGWLVLLTGAAALQKVAGEP